MTTEPGDPDPVAEDTVFDDPGPTDEEIERWEAAVDLVRAEHPDWSDAYIAGAIAYAVMTPEVQDALKDIAAQHGLDVERWTAVITSLMERFGPGTEQNWTEQECNDNLINLLRWSELEALPESVTQRIPDRPRFGPR